jgi:hypothetical protein
MKLPVAGFRLPEPTSALRRRIRLPLVSATVHFSGNRQPATGN